MELLEQNSIQWKMDRLGKWNGSEIWQLFKGGRKKDEMFGETAMSYIYEVASQRLLRDDYKNDPIMFEEYDYLNFQGNKYTEYGHMHEDEAATAFSLTYGFTLETTGSVPHPDIPNFAASPDRLCTNEEGKAVVEIKSPQPKTFVKYKSEINDAESLLKVKPEYYYQLQAEMAVTGLDRAYIVFWSHFMKDPLHAVMVNRIEEVQNQFKERIEAAEKIINELNKNNYHE